MVRLFADTYALIELLKGNPNYESYSDVELVSTEFNILELAYALFRDYAEGAFGSGGALREELGWGSRESICE